MHHRQSDSQFQNFGNFHMAYCNLLKGMIQVYKDTQSIQVSGHKLRSRPVRQCGLYGQDSRIRRHRFCVDIHSNAKIFAFRCIFLDPHPKLFQWTVSIYFFHCQESSAVLHRYNSQLLADLEFWDVLVYRIPRQALNKNNMRRSSTNA